MPTTPIIASASGDTTVIAAVSTRRFSIKRLFLVAKGAVDVQFKSGSTLISGVMSMAANGQIDLPDGSESFFIGTVVNNAFVINLSGAIVVGGFCVYEMREG